MPPTTSEWPVSFSQEHMLLRFELMRRMGVNTRGLSDHRAVFAVHSSVDQDTLTRALGRLVRRHPALRSGLTW
jgi:hypothetical protein